MQTPNTSASGNSISAAEVGERDQAIYADMFTDDSNSGGEELEENRDSIRGSRMARRTPTEMESIHFRLVNERIVNDITLDALYKPHTITVLLLLCIYLVYAAFTTEMDSTDKNVFMGLKALFILFMIISAMVFPNGPFIRPHPIFWRLIFGVSVLYALLLQFALYQNYDDVKAVLGWIDPVGLSHRNLTEKEYAINCTDVTLERIWSHLDIFAVGHFLGWAMKALLIRHTIICWYISIAWELTELVFAHLLPNFQECWWDAIILDVLVCNGLGILFGIYVSRFLEMRQFHWESIKNIRTIRGKLKRAVLQFTPESWMSVNWLQGSPILPPRPPSAQGTEQAGEEKQHNEQERSLAKEVTTWATTWAGLKRCFALYAFIMVWLTSELNIFFLKHVFSIDTTHPVVFWHIILIGLISAPTIRQYYIYVTDPKVKRMGMQCWLYLAICALEASICVKFGRSQLPALKLSLISLWIAFLAVGTIFCVWISVWWAKFSMKTKSVEIRGGGVRECFVDSSCENLGTLSEDVRRRRKKQLPMLSNSASSTTQ